MATVTPKRNKRRIVGWLHDRIGSRTKIQQRRANRRGGLLHWTRRLQGEGLESRLALDAAASNELTSEAATAELQANLTFPTQVYIPQDLVVRVGNTTTVPVQMNVLEDFGINLTGVDIAFSYDTTQFTVSNVRAGGALTGFGSFSGTSTPGTIRFTASRATAVNFPLDFIGPLVLFDIAPIAGPGTVSNLNLRISDGTFSTALFDETGQQLPLDPAPTNASTDTVDGKITVSTIARNTPVAEDVDDDTHVSGVDLVWVVSAINSPPSPSPGPVGKRLFLDVNGDGSVSGFDLVSVVSKLNSGGSLQAASMAAPASSEEQVGDNFDGLVFGISALASASSAPPTTPAGSSTSMLTAGVVDQAFAEFEREAFDPGDEANSTGDDLSADSPDDSDAQGGSNDDIGVLPDLHI